MQQQAQQEGVKLLVQGRLVWGQLTQTQKKNYRTKQLEFDKNNQPIMETVFGLAIPKPSPQSSQAEVENFNQVWSAIHTQAGLFGHRWPSNDFAWKFDDGDQLKDVATNTPFPAHYKGHIVIVCSTRIPVKLFAWDQSGVLGAVTAADIKNGDYVQVSLSVKGHGGKDDPNPGLYISPMMVARFAFGEAIQGSVDPNTVFTQRPMNMPAGASATPIGTMPQMGQAPSVPQMPGNFGHQQQGAPQIPNMGYNQQAPAPQMQQQNYTPNTNVLPPQMQQQQGAPQIPAMPNFNYQGQQG